MPERREAWQTLPIGIHKHPHDGLAHIALSCWICGSGSAWELWWVAAEGKQREGD